MKTYDKIIKEMKEHSKFFGFDIYKVAQGSEEWHRLKLGVLSASHAHEILAGGKTDTRMTYIYSLCGQILNKQPDEPVSAKTLDWGIVNEGSAREAFSFSVGLEIKQVPVIFKNDSLRILCSPDGILDGGLGLELKCPFGAKEHVKHICGDINPKHYKQCQFSMWVTGYDKWIYATYDPRSTIKSFHATTIDRDEKMMKQFDECVDECTIQIDNILIKLGIKFGYQWS